MLVESVFSASRVSAKGSAWCCSKCETDPGAGLSPVFLCSQCLFIIKYAIFEIIQFLLHFNEL